VVLIDAARMLVEKHVGRLPLCPRQTDVVGAVPELKSQHHVGVVPRKSSLRLRPIEENVSSWEFLLRIIMEFIFEN
jgi:hypothetical protein